ncbi:MAG: CPBP family intramembrane metalloprotease [Tannerella sp.]|jgi:membrane protease YdiL (CAAX protease family)|nr:CPBP family intramembrane metalloprotease [Tannerella sp.]
MKGLFEHKSPLFQFGILMFIFLVGLIFASLAATVTGFVTSQFADGADTSDLQFFNLHFSMVLSDLFAFFLPAVLTAYLCCQYPSKWLKTKTKPRPSAFLFAILMMIFMTPTVEIAGFLNLKLTLPEFMAPIETFIRNLEDMAGELTQTMLNRKDIISFITNLLVIGVLAGIVEEFLFRGALMSIIRRKITNPHVAVIIVAAIFSAVHFQFYGFLPRMILGVLLGYMLVLSGNIWVPVTAHFFNNAVAVIMVYTGISDTTEQTVLVSDTTTPAGWALASAIALCGIIITYYCAKKLTNFSVSTRNRDRDISREQ